MAMNFKKSAKNTKTETPPKEEQDQQEQDQATPSEPDDVEVKLIDPSDWPTKFQAVQDAMDALSDFGKAIQGVQIQTSVEESKDGELIAHESDSGLIPLKVSKPSSKVGGGLGTTVNTGDYNSLRFNASIEVPCAVGNEDATMDLVETWLGERIEGMYEKYMGDDE